MKRTAILFVFALALALMLAAFGGTRVLAEPTPGTQVHLPILTWLGQEADACDVVIEVQNVGNDFTKAMIFYWGEAGACPPQCNGPFKIECSGLLKPGATWNFLGPDSPAQVPPGAKKGIVFSLDARQEGGDIIADMACETAFSDIRQECNEYRRFKKSFEEDGGEGYFGTSVVGQPLAVEVVRKCQTATMTAPVVSAYSGIAEEMLGAFDPVFGGYAFYTPLLYADQLPNLNSWVYIQNAGLECTSVEIWLKTQGECIRSVIDEIPALAPGETYQWQPSDAGVGPFWQGNAWIRTSVPAAIVVDNWSEEVLMTYHGKPAELNYTFNPDNAFFTQGSQVNYGPLIYRENQGWDTNIQVQNLSSVVNAKVKVYFIDNSGDIIKTIVDWICPRGTQSFPLAVIDGLPGNWVGQVRVESQEWWTPGDPAVLPPNVVSIAELIRWDGPQQTVLLEGVAYNLFPEFQAYDWQVGKNVDYGVDLIGIPSFMNNMGGGGETGLTTELAIQNVVQKPGFTDFAIFIYDQNGLLDFVCEKLNEKQVEYINVADWNYINEGFKGSAVISVTAWEHHGSYSPGLAAVKVERFNWPLVPSPDPAFDAPGDQASASEGFPIFGDFHFQGPREASCPGQPETCTGDLFGTVVAYDYENDESGPEGNEPIEGAVVAELIDGGVGAADVTNGAGGYEIGVTPGNALVFAQGPQVTTTDEWLPDLSDNEYTTAAHFPRLQTASVACFEDEELDFVLICKALKVINVYDNSTEVEPWTLPIKGATAILTVTDNQVGGVFKDDTYVDFCVTDANGQCVLEVPLIGDEAVPDSAPWKLTINAPGYDTYTEEGSEFADNFGYDSLDCFDQNPANDGLEVESNDFALESFPNIRGKVFCDGVVSDNGDYNPGEEIAGVQVKLYQYDPATNSAGPLVGTTTTNVLGDYSFVVSLATTGDDYLVKIGNEEEEVENLGPDEVRVVDFSDICENEGD